MKLPLSLLIFCSGTITVVGQNKQLVKGIIADTASSVKLANASISILNAKDSTLVSFTRASKDGTFKLNVTSPGKVLLLACYPGYVDYVASLELTSEKEVYDFKTISMLLKSKLLEGVIVTGNRASIRLNGDTTEFNPSRFIIQPNDKVEDLLRQLPGIQIDQDGKITAHGKTVKKVLVDGEEFFGDDPTLVTKNLRSDMVAKVQLYDKKSEQATLTGIDDGVADKTINIQLKDDKKKGVFAKTIAGIGTDELHDAQLMFNRFNSQQKFSFYATSSTISAAGLTDLDEFRFNNSSSIIPDEGGGVYIQGDSEDDETSYLSSGLPNSIKGGIHYSDKWNASKNAINSSYKFGSQESRGNNNMLSINNLPTGFITSSSDKAFDEKNLKHKLDGLYSFKPDSVSTLQIYLAGLTSKIKSNSYETSYSERNNEIRLNEQAIDISSQSDQNKFNVTLLYTKKFKKKGRTISVNMTNVNSNKDFENYLKSNIDFYNVAGTVDSNSVINQFKNNNYNKNAFTTEIDFSESFSKRFSVWFSYDFALDHSDANRQAYNQSNSGKYDVFDPIFSNHYQVNQTVNQPGAIFNYKVAKTSITFGTKAAHVNFVQKDINKNDRWQRSFINWTPQASYKYKYSENEVFKVSYNGSTRQPSLEQLQPIVENSDPLNLYIGNPELKPAYSNSFQISYESRKIVKSKMWFVDGTYSFTNNQIVYNETTDTTGKTIGQSINLGNKTPSNASLNIYHTFRRPNTGFNISIGTNYTTNTNFNYSNGLLNKHTSFNYSATFAIGKYVKKFGGNLSIYPSYNVTRFSLQKDLNDNGFSLSTMGMLFVQLPLKMIFQTDGRYEFREKSKSFDKNFSSIILNAKLSKFLSKDQSLNIELSGHDLLDQNTGFNRSSSGSRLYQYRNTVLRRYFMLSLSYDFNKMGGSKPNK